MTGRKAYQRAWREAKRSQPYSGPHGLNGYTNYLQGAQMDEQSSGPSISHPDCVYVDEQFEVMWTDLLDAQEENKRLKAQVSALLALCDKCRQGGGLWIETWVNAAQVRGILLPTDGAPFVVHAAHVACVGEPCSSDCGVT